MKNKVVLIVSVLFGLLAAILTRTYLSAKSAEYRQLKDRFNRTHGTMDVLCYSKDVPGDTVLQKGTSVSYKTVPAYGLRGQALEKSQYDLIAGRKIMAGHRQGEVIFWADIEIGRAHV